MSRFVDDVSAIAARARTGMVTGEPGEPFRRTWTELHALARRIAGRLARSGLRPGQAVAVLAGAPVEIAPVAQAIWLAGGSMTMLHQPTARTDLEVWRDDTLRVLKMIDARVVVIGSPFEPMAPVLEAHGIAYHLAAGLMADPAAGGPADFTPVDAPEDFPALLQLTSGSTAEPKAVRITHRNLWSNLHDAATHLRSDESGVMVSWLPMFHDMGMVGCLLLPMISGMELVSVTPADFLGRPLLWAELMSRHHATITTAPNFAWAVLTRQLARVPDGTLDFSTLQIAGNGAEPIDPSTMEAFIAAGARFGMRPEAIQCCYGAAESTLVISLSEMADSMLLDVVDAPALESDRRAVPSGASAGVRRLPKLGRPCSTVEVRVAGEDGRTLGDREVGRIMLRGDSVTEGYLTPAGYEPARDADGWLDIGDEGYLVDGQVVVCGRRKDVIIMGGRNIYPTDIERAAATVPDVRSGNVAAVRLTAGDDRARESFAVLVESRAAGDPEAEERVGREVISRIVAEIEVRPAAVKVLPPGSLPKTPSGKLRRAAARSLL
ncbi:fatty acyl-AMP ligase [Actinoplanes sp. NPDC051411]|uniref:fatty acyl-AMP ligase n=1 Tax=Actinoplanes sp. NPDC051411 TaxID=3155522 RepID=UPI00344545D4